MLAMIERVVPYIALAKRVSSSGEIVTFLSACEIFTTGAKVLWTFPLGPSTWTVVSLTVTVTLSGTGMGCLPMRLMGAGSLPDVADEFATGLVAAAVGVLHQAARGGDDADPEAVEHARDFGILEIEAAAGGRDAREAGEGRHARDVLHLDDQGLVAQGVD